MFNNIYDNVIKEIEIQEKLTTLILDSNIIECRKSDYYINATELCKATNINFDDWFGLKSTRVFFASINYNTKITALDLIDTSIEGE